MLTRIFRLAHPETVYCSWNELKFHLSPRLLVSVQPEVLRLGRHNDTSRKNATGVSTIQPTLSTQGLPVIFVQVTNFDQFTLRDWEVGAATELFPKETDAFMHRHY